MLGAGLGSGRAPASARSCSSPGSVFCEGRCRTCCSRPRRRCWRAWRPRWRGSRRILAARACCGPVGVRLAVSWCARPGPRLPWLARPDHHQPRHPPAPRPPTPAPRPAHAHPPPRSGRRAQLTGQCRSRRLTSTTKEPSRRHLHRLWDATPPFGVSTDPMPIRPGPPRPGNSACMTRRRVADLGLADLRRVPGCTAHSRWLIITCACASTALPVMPHSGRHSGRPISTPRRRTRTRHRSPPRTGCVLLRLTSAPTRTGPAHGGAAARGRCCGGIVRTPRTVPGSPRGSGQAHAGWAARPGLRSWGGCFSCMPYAGPQRSGHRPCPPPRFSCVSAVYSWLVVAWPARAVIRSSLSRPCSIKTAAAVERVQRRRARMSSRRASTLGVRFTEIFSVLVSSMCGTLPQSAEGAPRAQPAGRGALTSSRPVPSPVPRRFCGASSAAAKPGRPALARFPWWPDGYLRRVDHVLLPPQRTADRSDADCRTTRPYRLLAHSTRSVVNSSGCW
jgi:hypothetical protein